MSDDVRRATLVVLGDIARVLACRDGSLMAFSGSDVRLQTRMQVAFRLKYNDPVLQVVHEMIVRYASEAEKVGPGTFETCIEFLSDLVLGKGCGPNNEFSQVGLVPSSDDVSDILMGVFDGGRKLVREAMIEATKQAGASGKIVIEKTENDVMSIELIDGYVFAQRPAWTVTRRIDSPKVICVDGYVEEVSELHHVLEAAAEAHSNVVLFVRGLSPDVIHTLKVNYDRGTLSVLPVIVEFDLAGLNTLNDIAAVVGADLVSSNKGDLISAIRLELAPTVDSILLDAGQVIIVCKSARQRAAVQLTDLHKRLQTETNDDKAKLLAMRIRSLSPRLVIVRLPDDRNYAVNRQLIDRALRAVRAAIDHGVVIRDGLAQPALSEASARVFAKRCHDRLIELGAVVTSS